MKAAKKSIKAKRNKTNSEVGSIKNVVEHKEMLDTFKNLSEKALQSILFYYDLFNSYVSYDTAWQVNLTYKADPSDSLTIISNDFYKNVDKTTLNLHETNVSRFITQASTAKTIILSKCYFPLGAHYPECTRLRLERCQLVLSDSSQEISIIESLLEKFPKLESLELMDCLFIPYFTTFSYVVSTGRIRDVQPLQIQALSRQGPKVYPNIKSVSFHVKGVPVIRCSVFEYFFDIFPNLESLSYLSLVTPMLTSMLIDSGKVFEKVHTLMVIFDHVSVLDEMVTIFPNTVNMCVLTPGVLFEKEMGHLHEIFNQESGRNFKHSTLKFI